MTHINAPGVVQVVQYFSLGGNNAENVYHVSKTVPIGFPDLSALLGAFRDWENGPGKALRSNDVTTIGFRATDLTDLEHQTAFLGVDIDGTVASAMMPASVTVAIKANTGTRGRGRQGRTFWVGLTEDQCDENIVNATVLDDIVDALGSLEVDVAALPDFVGLCVLHKQRDGVPLDPQQGELILNFSYTDQNIDVQKDRLPGHKKHKRSVAP